MQQSYQNPQPERNQNSQQGQKGTHTDMCGSRSDSIALDASVSATLAAYQRGEIANLAAALGNVAKSFSAPAKNLQQRCTSRPKKRYHKPTPEERRELLRNSRRQRYLLQREARRLLKVKTRLNKKGQAVPYRINNCLEAAVAGRGVTAAVLMTPDGSTAASFRKMQTCGSVWHCAVCSARVANERQKEMTLAVKAAEAKGLKALLCTFTARHNAMTDLRGQLKAMGDAYADVWGGEAAKDFKARFKMPGGIRSHEVTHSIANGWHPHIHAIYFIDEEADVQAFADWVRIRWERFAAVQGLTMNGHGFDCVNSSAKVAQYIAKWGKEPNWRESDELARWHTKRGAEKRTRAGHYGPQQLLEFSINGDTNAGDLWVEYAEVYQGKRQLYWSTRLRKFLGLKKERTDEEICESEVDEATEQYSVYAEEDDWNWIKGNDLKVEFLEMLEDYSIDEITQHCQQAWGIKLYIMLPTKKADQSAKLEEDEPSSAESTEAGRRSDLGTAP